MSAPKTFLHLLMCWALCCLTASFSSAQSISASPADTTICEGDTAFLSVSGGGSYSWSPAVVPVAVDYSLVKAAPAATTTYTVTSINADGTTSSAFATVNIKPPPEPIILYSSNVGCDSVHSADPGGQEGQHDCIQACDSSKVIYSTIAHPGSSYVWSVVGGTIVSGQNTDSICVLWGAVGNGSVTLTETDTCGNVGETELCIKIIESPIALFTANDACIGDPTYFTELATGEDSYYWEFGDGNTSTSPNPVHTYGAPGVYTATLWVTNECNCVDSFSMVINIDATPGPDIECITAVCEGDTATYSTDAVCSSYVWTVTGGTILSGQGTPDVTVSWGAGPIGTIVLAVSGCSGVYCTTPTTVQVPIIPNSPVILGDNVVCEYSSETYSLPCLPGVIYDWSVTGGFIMSGDGTHSIHVQWYGAGTGTVSVNIHHPLLDCGGSGSLTVDIRPQFFVFGPPSGVCLNSISTITAYPPGAYNWTTTGGTIISGWGTDVIQIDWNTGPGTFDVTVVPANPNDFCNDGETLTFNVIEVPAPDLLVGDIKVCPGQPYIYTASTSTTGTTFLWTVQNGAPATSSGNPITVVWDVGASGPYQVSVQNVMVGFPNCPSQPISLSVDSCNLSTSPVISGPSACVDEVKTYSISTAGLPTGAQFCWSVGEATDGSIINGQGTSSIDVSWNNVPDTAVVKLEIKVCNSSVLVSKTVAINPSPSVAISAGILCEGATATLNASGAVSYVWSTNVVSSAGAGAVVNAEDTYSVIGTDANGCSKEVFIFVPEKKAPTAYITTPDPQTYCPGDPINTTFYTPDDNPLYTFLWTPGGGTGPSFNVTSPGTYTVTVTNSATGCTATDNMTVSVLSSCPSDTGGCQTSGVISSSFSTTSFCNTFNFHNSSSGGSNFTWNFDDGNSIFQPGVVGTTPHTYTEAGFYNVNLTGWFPPCSLSRQHIIKVRAAANFEFLVGCVGAHTCFTDLSTVLPGHSIVGYSWNFGDSSPLDNSPNPCHIYTAPGTYNVTLTITEASGCIAVITKQVTIAPPPVAAFSISSGVVCANDPAIFSDASTGGVMDWQWNFGDGATASSQNPAHTYVSPGSYNVVLSVTDAAGCSDATLQNITVLAPENDTISYTGSLTICQGECVTLTAPGIGPWLWSNGATIQTISICDAGTYYAEVVGSNGCSYQTASVNVIMIPFPEAVVTSSNGKQLCAGEFTILSAPAGSYNYQWYKDGAIMSGETASTLYVWMAGNYHITVTDPVNGCVDTSAVCEIIIHPLPTVSISASGSSAFCEGGSVVLNATGSPGVVNYNWNTGANGQQITVTEGGSYTVTVTDTNGCQNTASYYVTVYPMPEMCEVMTGCIELCFPDTLPGPAGPYAGYYTYQWLLNGLPVAPPDGNLQNLPINQPGDYSLILTTIHGCTDTSDILTVEEAICDSCFAASDDAFIKIWDSLTITNNTVWAGKYYLAPGVIVTVDGAVLDLTNVDVVFGECAGIDFVNQATIRANNSVFRPCEMDLSWRGFRFESYSSGIIDECTFKNAQRALHFFGNFQTSADARIQNNLFSNCQRAIVIERTTFSEAITGNTFVIENTDVKFNQAPCTSLGSNLEHWGIYALFSTFEGLISQNDFINSFEDKTKWHYGITGLRCQHMEITENTFSDMYRSIDLGRCANISIENNDVEVTRDYDPAEHQIRISKGSSNIWLTGNVLKDGNTYGGPTGSNSAIYLHRVNTVYVNENHIEGFETAIQAGNLNVAYITNNEIVNGGFFGIYLDKCVRTDVACNQIDMDLKEWTNSIGIAVFGNNTVFGQSVNDRVTIRSNCITECSNSIYLSSPAFSALIPHIRNNYLYNYSEFGIYNNAYVGSIGFNGTNFSDAGRNTFMSNNIPNGAVDVFSNTNITVAGNFGINVVSAMVNEYENDIFHSTASCGHQIYNNPNQEIGPDEICDNFEANLRLMAVNDGNGYYLTGNYREVLAGFEAGSLFDEGVRSLMQLLANEPGQVELDRLYDELSADTLLSAQELLWLAFYYHLEKGDLVVAGQLLNDVDISVGENGSLQTIERTLLNARANGWTLDAIPSYLLSELESVDAISGSHASDVRDILQGAKGLHDYRFSTTAEPRYEEVEGSLVDLSVTLLEIYPNPARDEIFVNYNFDNRPGSKIRLFDVAGKLFKEVPAAYDHSVFKLDVSDLPTGIYILAIQNEDGFVAKGKFVKLAE